MSDIIHEAEARFGWMRSNPTWQQEAELVQRLCDEIKRLHEENKVLSETLLVKETLPEIIYEEKDEEIKRLRGLLREWRDRGKHDRFYTTDFEKHVREALEERE